MKTSITLRKVEGSVLVKTLLLEVKPDQLPYVGTVAEALDEARDVPQGKPWYRAVFDREQAVGFVMLSWNVKPDPPFIIGPWFLWKLIVDRRFQGQGYGRKIVEEVCRIIRKEGAAELLTSFSTGQASPEMFYKRLGFEPTGEFDNEGETIVSLKDFPI
jgi:diamine N-acetyltransferase